MKKIFALASIAFLASAIVASAAGGFVNLGGGVGGAFGNTKDLSGASNWSASQSLGNANGLSSTTSYGISESTLQGSFKTGPNGKTTLSGSTLVGSGSKSDAASGSNGNGASGTTTGGSGFGSGLTYGGSGQLSGALHN